MIDGNAANAAESEDFARFTRRLIGLARRHLDMRIQQKVDPEDVVQSAYKSFLLRYGEGAKGAYNWDGLWGMMTVITLRKCADRVRFYKAERRDLGREASASADPSGPGWIEAIGREPTPEQAAALAETVELMLKDLDADERPIIEMSLQGYSTQEISDELGRAERSVRRLRERVKIQLKRQNDKGLDG